MHVVKLAETFSHFIMRYRAIAASDFGRGELNFNQAIRRLAIVPERHVEERGARKKRVCSLLSR